MTYVISDIHGCFEEYQEALRRIEFGKEDTLYVLGDCVDRGPSPVAVLQDMMSRPNVFPLIGNHDLTALWILKKLCVEITEENARTWLTAEFVEVMNDWLLDGGQTTMADFQKLSFEEQMDVLEYLGEFVPYEELEVLSKKYLLVHGGMEPFEPGKAVKDYDLTQLVMARRNLNQVYFTDRYTITGHTPTITETGNEGTIIHRNNHIAIDCGCVFGYNLAVLCLETGEEFYIPCRSVSRKKG